MGLLPRHISRRTFLRGAAATGIGTIAVSALASCGRSGSGESGDPVVVDSGSATYVLGSGNIQGSYQQASDDNGGTSSLGDVGTWTIPLGCVLRPSEGVWKAYLAPGEAASPMAVAGAFSTASGKALTFVKAAQAGGNYVVFDAQCSDTVFAWSELDIVSRDWKLFAAAINKDGTLGTPSSLWEASADYDPPQVVCSGSSVLWLVMPATGGSKVTENSSCYLWRLGATSADEVVRSQGRFACPPSVSDGMVTLTPRVRVNEGRFYGITAYPLDNKLASTTAELVLPQSVQPMHAVYMDGVFAFSIEANYGTGGLLGNMGTYIGNGSDPFVVLPREPAAQVSGKDGVYLVKTLASHLIVDTNAKTYATLVAPNRALDYGDYPASMGTTSQFVSFATVKDEDTGYPSSVTVRAFSL